MVDDFTPSLRRQGLVGAALILVGAVIAAAFGIADAILAHPLNAMGALSEATVLAVVGGLVLLFAYLGEHDWKACWDQSPTPNQLRRRELC